MQIHDANWVPQALSGKQREIKHEITLNCEKLNINKDIMITFKNTIEQNKYN